MTIDIFPLWLRHGYATINARLTALYRLSGCVTGIPAKSEVRSKRLRRGEVMRLAGECRRLEIRHGTVWLTTTPASGDVLLQSGDSFELRGRANCVLESLEDAELTVSAQSRC